MYDGERPPSALEAIQALGPAVGPLVVVDVGYNDSPAGYGAALDRVMRALLDTGVERVVWVTLRERRPSWAEINDAIRAGARRWPQISVGEWDRESVGHDEWFADGIHMNWDGGTGFARFLRALVLDACTAACAPGDGVLAVRTDGLRKAHVGARYVGRLEASGGTPPYRWSVVGLPQPLHLRSDGAIWGRPRTSGTFELVAAVVDATGVRNRGSSSSVSAARAGDATQPPERGGRPPPRCCRPDRARTRRSSPRGRRAAGPGAVVDTARCDGRLVEGIDGLGSGAVRATCVEVLGTPRSQIHRYGMSCSPSPSPLASGNSITIPIPSGSSACR